jgi:hypothetical protein
MQDLAAGQIDLLFDAPATSLPLARAGSIKAYAATSDRRLVAAADIPTFSEFGLAEALLYGVECTLCSERHAKRKSSAKSMRHSRTPAIRPVPGCKQQSHNLVIHSALIPAAFMIGHHFSASAFCRTASASGVCCSRGKISVPNSEIRDRTSGSASVSTVYLKRSPDTAKPEDVRGFQLHLTSSGAGTPKINATVAALRFARCGAAVAPATVPRPVKSMSLRVPSERARRRGPDYVAIHRRFAPKNRERAEKTRHSPGRYIVSPMSPAT